MRTTLTLDDDVLAHARSLSKQKQLPLGTVISDLARQGLTHVKKSAATRNGITLFPVRKGAGIVTSEKVKALLEEND